jgi:hypothetical protein
MRITFLILCLTACGDNGHLSTDATPLTPDAEIDASTGTTCGGFANAQCGPSEFCDFANNGCGDADEVGTCQPRPTTCPDTAGIAARPTCGCDKTVYGGECDANAAGVDLDAHGNCPVPQGSFACGYTQCSLQNQYCKREVHARGGDTFSCVPLPGCPSQFPNCACLANEPCGSVCTGNGPTGLTLTCQ